MKTLFSTFAAVLVTLCTTSTALADTPAPVPADGLKISAPNVPQFYYSVRVDPYERATFLVGAKPMTVKEGEIARFECEVTGEPWPSVVACYNGKEIDQSKRTSSGGIKYDFRNKAGYCSLTIFDTQDEDDGIYSFFAENTIGTDETFARLTVRKNE